MCASSQREFQLQVIIKTPTDTGRFAKAEFGSRFRIQRLSMLPALSSSTVKTPEAVGLKGRR